MGSPDRADPFRLGAGALLLVLASVVAYFGFAMGPCGVTQIHVAEVSGEVEDPGAYVPYETLSDEQRRLFDEARETGEARDADNDVDPFPRVAYEGDYYRVTAEIAACPASPESLLFYGAVFALLGAAVIRTALR